MSSELDFDIIKGLSKWRSELETYIDFENFLYLIEWVFQISLPNIFLLVARILGH
jgi:hypothetical protein